MRAKEGMPSTVTVALAYPNTEAVGVADPGFEALSTRLAALPNLTFERFFLQEGRSPDRRLLAFDVVVLFLSHEGDCLNALRFLRQAGLPLLASERQEGWPLVALEGPCARRNPEPLAPFVDLVFLDDQAWDPLGRGFLERAFGGPGVYIPRLYKVFYKEDGTVAEVTAEGGAPLPVHPSPFPLPPEGINSALPEAERRPALLEVGAGTERLRHLIGIPMDDRELFDAVDRAVSSGARHLRLSFWIGLPTEREEDTSAIPRLVKQVKHHLLKHRQGSQGMGEIVVSLQTFVPRAWTVFQWVPMAEVGILEERIRKIARALRSQGIRVTHDVPKWAYLQGLLARADRRASVLLRLALAKQGDWRRAFREWFLNPEFFALRPRPLEEVFPWDHLFWGKDRLVEAYRRRLET